VKSTSDEASHYAIHHPVTSSPFGSSSLLSILFSNTFIEYTTKILGTGSALVRTHPDKNFSIKESDGHAIAPLAFCCSDRFNSRVVHAEYVVEKVALGQVFLHALQFYIAIIPQILYTHLSSTAGGIGPFKARAPSGSVSPHSYN
jgi:hypothetical protein